MKLIECPRDAMQGLPDFVPTSLKVHYLNLLLNVGFDTLDFGSFVSPKAIPQLRDTAEVLSQLDLTTSFTKLLAIVANLRGGEDACRFAEIDYLGFPLSVSETFQLRNTNKTIAQSMVEVAQLQELCLRHQKTLVIYLSMGFGNPYGDPYSPQLVIDFTGQLVEMGITVIAPSDTIGSSAPDTIIPLFRALIPAFPTIEFGAHLHATPQTVFQKIQAVHEAGVQRIDGALRGFGGCPMAKDDLTGNLPTEQIIIQLEGYSIDLQLNKEALQEALLFSQNIFS
ncbi:MAG: hydroxymethylglutaryl-CoA lyase [Spirosomataceae bacterium]